MQAVVVTGYADGDLSAKLLAPDPRAAWLAIKVFTAGMHPAPDGELSLYGFRYPTAGWTRVAGRGRCGGSGGGMLRDPREIP